MSNGRSFKRNRKGSPGKSQRRARQRQQSNDRFQQSIQEAANSASAALEGMAESIQEMLSKLSEIVGHEVTVEEAAEIAAMGDGLEVEDGPEEEVVGVVEATS